MDWESPGKKGEQGGLRAVRWLGFKRAKLVEEQCGGFARMKMGAGGLGGVIESELR